MERLCRAQAQAERKVGFRGKGEGEHEASNRVVCGSKHRCMRGSKYMKMPGKRIGPKFLAKSVGKWDRRHLGGMTWSEGWTDRKKSCYLAESVREMRGKEWGRRWIAAGRKRWAERNLAKCGKEFKLSKKVESQPRKQRIGGFKDKKEKNHEKGVLEANKQV